MNEDIRDLLMQLLGEHETLTHDDMLVLRCRKSMAGVSNSWRDQCVPERVIGWYRKGADEKYIPWSKDSAPTDEDLAHGWRPASEWGRNVTGGGKLLLWHDTFDLRLPQLWNDTRRRYRLMLEGLVQAAGAGVLEYSGSYSTGSREHGEAIRNRLKRHWRVAAYEHDLIFSGETADCFLREMRQLAQKKGLHEYEHTVYISGHDTKAKPRNQPLLVKVYRMAKHGLPELVKLETTFRGEWLRRNKEIKGPDSWGNQTDIQENLLKAALVRVWKNEIFNNAPETTELLTQKLGTSQRDLFVEMARPGRTLTERVAALEKEAMRTARRLDQTARRLERLEALNGIKALNREIAEYNLNKPREW